MVTGMMTLARHAPSPLAEACRAAATRPLLWLHRVRSRRRLRDLDARALEDIGLSEDQRRIACARWFWQGDAF